MEPSSYGLWFLVFFNSAIFIIFAFSFFKPQTKRDWRSFGAFSAFLVALFYRNVRLSADDLFFSWLAAKQLSQHRLAGT